MKEPLNEKEIIDKLNTFLCILTSSKELDNIQFDRSELKINNRFLNLRLDYISITNYYITSLLTIDKTKFGNYNV